MDTKAIIRWTWELQNKYNNGKSFVFFQDYKEAIKKELADAEENGMYYKAYANLAGLYKELE